MQGIVCRAVDVGVLLWLAVLDVLDGNPMTRGPFLQLFTDVFRAVIDPNSAGLAAPFDDPIPVRATPFVPEVAPAREALSDSRTLKGGGAAGIATVGAAGVEVAQEVLAETQSAILPLVVDFHPEVSRLGA